MSQDSARIALAARIHVLLRRKTGRVTDTEWMAQNLAYASEVVRLCRADGDEELVALADTVTEMTLVKHHYQLGVPAQRGIED